MARNLIATLTGLVISALLVAGAFAAKPSSPTLIVSFSTASSTAPGTSVPYATPYVVSGCGYGSTGVTVVVHSPEAISFAGQVPDSNGCISVSNFSTQGPGHYTVDAYQQTRNHSSLVAETTFDLS
jgi:hypothetical protein